jgi:hypothetical protein
MQRKVLFLIAAAAFLQPSLAFAQAQSLVSLGLKCADFQKNEDGTWTPTHTLSFPAGGGRMTLSKKDILGPTTFIAGYHLGAMVNAECLTPAH